MKKKSASLAATALVDAGLVVGIASPANAALSDCPSGSFCGWHDLSYTGTGPYGGPSNQFFIGIIPNDMWTSVYNHGVTSNVRAYDDANYGGASLFVGRGSAIADLRTYGMNDKISSFLWI